MKRVLVIVGLIGAVAVAGLLTWRTRGADSETAGVEIVRVTRRDLATFVKATGVIKPSVGAEVRVGSRVSGVVNRLHVRVGDSVTRGQLLAELDDRDLRAQRDQADANLRRALVDERYARIDCQRLRDLAAAKVAAPGDLDVAERALAVAEQQVAVARATLAYASTQVDYARIVAPIAGVVASVSTQEGETVAASFASPTFVTLIDLSRLEVWAYVDETDIGRIQPGQPVRFTVDTYTDANFAGTVTTIYPKAEIRDNVVDYVTVVRFALPKDRVLRPEMTATVRIALQHREHVLSLPLRALRTEAGRTFVECQRAGGVERRWVTQGLRDETFCEIVNGLHDGDAVLVGDANQKEEP